MALGTWLLEHWWVALLGYAVAFAVVVALGVRDYCADERTRRATEWPGIDGDPDAGSTDRLAVALADDDGDEQARRNLTLGLDPRPFGGSVLGHDGFLRPDHHAAGGDSGRAAETPVA